MLEINFKTYKFSEFDEQSYLSISPDDKCRDADQGVSMCDAQQTSNGDIMPVT